MASAAPAGLVAYACDVSVLLYSPALHRTVGCLVGHTAAVRCVRVLRDVDAASSPSAPPLLRLVSGGVDRTLRCWTLDRASNSVVDVRVLRGHGGAVNAVDGCWLGEGEGLRTAVLVSASQDHSMRVWTSSCPSSPPFAADWQCVQTLPYSPSSLLLSVALLVVQQRHDACTLLLAAGGVDCSARIHLARVPLPSAASASSSSSSSSQFPPPPSTAPAVHFHHAVALSGHLDWVRCLSFTRAPPSRALREVEGEKEAALSSEDVLLATASQDHTIRLWRLQWTTTGAQAAGGTELQPPTTSSLGSRGCEVHFADSLCTIRLDSLLEGHEDWVMNATFQPTAAAAATSRTPSLLSCGADGAAIVWTPPQEAGGVWRLQSRLGQMSVGGISGLFGVKWGPKGRAVMAHGYSGAMQLWTSAALGHSADSAIARPPAVFASVATASGHSLAVTDLSWEPRGRYVVSVSDDQTTRLFAPVPTLISPRASASSASSSPPWLELARPQLHGYDLRSVHVLAGPVPHLLASGADEKVIRVFLATQTFVHSLDRLSPPPSSTSPSAAISSHSSPPSTASPAPPTVIRAIRAHLPELGLSNRGLQSGDEVQQLRGFSPHHTTAGEEEGSRPTTALRADGGDEEEDDDDGREPAADLLSSTLSPLSAPPTDAELSLHTLWPEVDKLYGHGSELRVVTASADGRLLASSCTAKTREAAAILFFDTATWSCVGRVTVHTTTVSCLAFSPSTSHASPTLLLSGSKDRHVALTLLLPAHHQVQEEKGEKVPLSSEKASPSPAVPLRAVSVRLGGHSRIVWSCAWALDGRVFATASRDRSVRLWSAAVEEGEGGAEPRILVSPAPTSLLAPFTEAVTAVAFAPLRRPSPSSSVAACYELAVGGDSGAVSLWRVDWPATAGSSKPASGGPLSWDGARCQLLTRIHPSLCPQRTVHRLAFRPLGWEEEKRGEGGDGSDWTDEQPHQLAVAAADHTLRILQLAVPHAREAEDVH